MIPIDKFIEIFEENVVMVERGTVQLETELLDLVDWDSMAYITLNANLDENYGFTLKAQELNGLISFSDIVEFIKARGV